MNHPMREISKEYIIKTIAEELLKGNSKKISLIKSVKKRVGVNGNFVEETLLNLRKRGLVLFTREFITPTLKGLLYFTQILGVKLEEVLEDGE